MSDDHSEIPEHLQGSALSLEASFQSLFQQSPLLSPHARIAFETLETLGRGGMGTVYAVRDRRLDREAALKLLSHSSGDYVARTRFLREAKITAKLDHPAIPPVYETGLTPDGQLYMLMKRIRGKTLKDCITDCHEDGILTIEDLLSVLVKVSEAIAYAHQKGIVHRDLKPENIMVGEFGEVLVIDWGIAKDLHSLEVSPSRDLFRDSCPVSAEDLVGAGVTVSGTLIGTPGYMAPEQIEGDMVDTRVDIFALGANLVEIVTGEKAVSGNSAIEKIAATMSGSVSCPIDLDPRISPELNWIANRALQSEQDQRTECADDFVIQLKAYLAGRPIPGYPYSKIESWRRALRQRAGLAFGIMVSAFLLALLGNFWLTLELEAEKRLKAETEILDVHKKLDDAEDQVKRNKEVLVLQNKARALAKSKVSKALLVKAVEAALARGDRNEIQLLTAAEIYQIGRCSERAVPLLKEAVRRFPPSYRGLFELHKLSVGEDSVYVTQSDYLKLLISEAEKRGDVNEFLLFSRGVKLQSAGKVDEALKAYQQAEKYSRSLAALYNNRGVIWKNKKEVQKALNDYSRSIEIEPDYPLSYYNRGLLWVEMGKPDEALADFKNAVLLDPLKPESYAEIGKLYSQRGQYVRARQNFNKAIELNPDDAEFYCYRGINFSRQRLVEKALNDFKKSIELDPVALLSYYNRGSLLMKLEKYDEAILDFNRTIELSPKFSPGFLARGRCWQGKGERQRAIADYSVSLKYDPSSIDSYFYRAVAYQEDGKFELALQDYRKVMELDPGHFSVFLNRALLYKRTGEINKAFGEYDRAIEAHPKEYDAYFQRGRLSSQRDLLENALADFNKALELRPRESKIYYERSDIYRRMGKVQESLDDLNRTIQLSPERPLPYGSRATLYQSLKQFDKALTDINTSIEKRAPKPVVFCIRAEIYTALGRKAEAIRDYETFLRIAPGKAGRSEALRALEKLKAENNK